MCTAVTYKTKDFYFGRNLDYEFSYGESIAVMPRNYLLKMRMTDDLAKHYAIVGMAHISGGYPLFYDAVNEKGLCIAGLNFVGNAVYRKPCKNLLNIAQFELIPWLLGKCCSVKEARELLKDINLTDTSFAENMPVGQLHWMAADRSECIVIESMEDGMHIYENPVGVLTNNPPFPMQMFALNNYRNLSVNTPNSTFPGDIALEAYSRGMGALGLPGDLSSQSRFVRAAFVRGASCSESGEKESVSQFFHILGSVEQQRGCCRLGDGKNEFTIYSSCCSADKGIYYYKSYENSQISAVDMYREDLDSDKLISYPFIQEQNVLWQNRLQHKMPENE